MAVKKYTLSGKEYSSKEKYSLKIWGKIFGILKTAGSEDPLEAVSILLSEEKLVLLLNLILDRDIEDELYEEDFEVVTKILSDFFSRKTNLMNTTTNSSKG